MNSMITLEEYILQNNIKESKLNFIDKEFLYYFLLEWRLNHLQFNVSENFLYESINIYDGQIEQANIIDKEFQKITNKENQTIKISKDIFKGIDNVNFNYIYIHIKYTSNDEYAVYKQSDTKYNNYNEVRWNTNDKVFNFVEIYVFVTEESISIRDLILHELRHYWDDYNSFKSCNTILDIAARNPKYKRFIYKKSDDAFIGNVKQINNMFSSIETNSYIDQIIGQISDILKGKSFVSVKEAIDILIESKPYKKYKLLKEFIINILNNKENQKLYIESYKKITNTTLSDDKIINQLEHKFNKFWFKLQKGIYQYIDKNHLIKESILSASTRNFIIK